MALRVGASRGKSALYPVCSFSSEDIMYLICHVTPKRPHHGGVMRIHGWELLLPMTPPPVCHHSAKFFDHRHCDSGDIFFIYHVILLDYRFKGLCEIMGGSPSW